MAHAKGEIGRATAAALLSALLRRSALLATATALCLCTLPARAGTVGSQSSPAIASDGQGFLLAWLETDEGSTSRLCVSRVDRDGVALDSPSIELDRGTIRSVDVAFSGGIYAVVWISSTGSDLFVARLAPDGRVVDRQNIAAPDPFESNGAAMVAPLDDGFLACWENHGILTAVIHPDGTAAPAQRITPYGSTSVNPKLASDGTHVLLAMQSFVFCDPCCYSGPYGVGVRRLSSTGTFVDDFISLSSLFDAGLVSFDLASNGANFLMVVDHLESGAPTSTAGTSTIVIDAGGDKLTFSDPRNVFDWGGHGVNNPPRSGLAWSGDHYVIASTFGVPLASANVCAYAPPNATWWFSALDLPASGAGVRTSTTASASVDPPKMAATLDGRWIAVTLETDHDGVSRLRLRTSGDLPPAVQARQRAVRR